MNPQTQSARRILAVSLATLLLVFTVVSPASAVVAQRTLKCAPNSSFAGYIDNTSVTTSQSDAGHHIVTDPFWLYGSTIYTP